MRVRVCEKIGWVGLDGRSMTIVGIWGCFGERSGLKYPKPASLHEEIDDC